MGKLFGTDGVRGVAGKDLTCELALQIGRATAAELTSLDGHRPRILIGKDTRGSHRLGSLTLPMSSRVAPISACVFLQRVSGNLECNKNGRTFDANFEKRANGAACPYGVLCPLARVACYGV